MKTIKLKVVTFIVISFPFLGASLTAQTNNIAPPSIGAVQNKTNTPVWLSLNNFSNSNQKEQAIATPMEIVNETVWDGKTWSQGEPDVFTKAVLNANYNTSDILNAYDIVIKDGVTLTLNDGGLLKIKQPLYDITKAKIILNEGSGLFSRSPNSTLSVFSRNNGFVNKFSSMFMSTPVAGTPTSGQKIGDTYDGLDPTYDTAYGQYDSSGLISASTYMIPGKGYIETVNGVTPYDNPGQVPPIVGYNPTYTGTENTSDYPMSVGTGYNLLGNPYATSLDADSFLLDSSNTTVSSIFLWTRNTLASSKVSGGAIFNFSTLDYAIYNVLGGVSAGKDITLGSTSGNTNTLIPFSARENTDTPDGKIAIGTSFYVRATGSGTATFKNTMTTTPTAQVFRNANHRLINTALIAPPTRSRIWINLAEGSSYTSGAGQYKQALIGYATGATNADDDRLFDAAPLTHATYNPLIDVYSFAPSSSKVLAIQGRGNFQPTDSFQLGYSTNLGGTFTFATTHDGIFTTQPYYILDATDGQYHTLPYTFITASGTFNSRFKIVFENLIGFVFPTNICGSQLTNINNSVYAYNLTGTTNYHFQVSNDSAFSSIFGEFSGANPTYPYVFNLNLPGITFNTTYWVRVATYQLNGIWQYGPICQIKTPTNPPTSYLSSNSCNTTVSSYWSTIYAQQIYAVGFTGIQYTFNATVGGNTYSYTTPLENPVNSRCNLHSFVGMPLIPNTVYSFKVDVLWNEVWQIGTTICTITSPNALPRFTDATFSIFEANAYPNPFANNFKVELNTSSEENISLKAYDMLGRMVEAREANITDFDSQEIGNEFTSGVYNIIITQGENVKSLRVVKR